MWFKWITGDVGRIWDRTGQLGDSGDNCLGRLRVVWIINSELQGGSPLLSWIRTDRLASVSKFELYTSAYGISWGPANWVASCVTETEAILPYLTTVHQDSARATHGVSLEAYAWKMCTRVRWGLIVSLITSWTIATHSALLACVCRVVRFLPLKGLNWLESLWHPQIWVTLAHRSHSVEL
jgi:hypothetical protein